MVIWEHNFWKGGKNKLRGSGDSFSSPGLPRVWQIPFYFDFRVPSVECGVWSGKGFVCVCLWVCFGFCLHCFLISFGFDYFHCSECFPLQN